MEIRYAKIIAGELTEQFSPFCERIKIAGSIRRHKPNVKDIEIVATPKPGLDIFGQPDRTGPTAIDKVFNSFMINRGGRYLQGAQRYKKAHLAEGIVLDMFLVLPPAQWGVIFAIRTGPAKFSQWLVTPRRHGGALPSYCRVRDGGVYKAGAKAQGPGARDGLILMPEEKDFFDLLGLDWIEPEARGTQ